MQELNTFIMHRDTQKGTCNVGDTNYTPIDRKHECPVPTLAPLQNNVNTCTIQFITHLIVSVLSLVNLSNLRRCIHWAF